jgi:hypothetical protein
MVFLGNDFRNINKDLNTNQCRPYYELIDNQLQFIPFDCEPPIAKKIDVNSAHGEYTGLTFFSSDVSKIFFSQISSVLEKGGKTYLADMLLHFQEMGFSLTPVFTQKLPRTEVDFKHDLIEARNLIKKF